MISLIKKILLLGFVVSSLFAQVGDGSQLLKELQDKYKSINDFTSTFRQVTQNGHVAAGKFYYKTKDKFRIELNSRIILGDGESVWNYSPKNHKVIITSADDEANSFSIEDYVFNYPKLCKVGAIQKEGEKKILLLIPASNELDFKEIKLVVNDNLLIDQISLTDLMDNTYKADLLDTMVNQNLSNDLFIFEIPQGTQIIDLR